MLCLGATMQAQTNIMQVTKFIRTAKIGGSYVIQVNTNGANNWVTVGGGIDDVLAMNQPLSAHRTIRGGSSFRNFLIDSIGTFTVNSYNGIEYGDTKSYGTHSRYASALFFEGYANMQGTNGIDSSSSLTASFNGIEIASSKGSFAVQTLRKVTSMANKLVMTWDSTNNRWEAALLDSIIVLGAGSGIASLGNSPYGLTKPNDSTYTADSSLLATRLRLKHVNDSTAAALTAEIGTRLEIADTTDMLTPYLRKIDTTGKWIGSGWLSLFVKYGDTSSTIATRTWVQAQGYITTRDRLGLLNEDTVFTGHRQVHLNNYRLSLDSGALHITRKINSPISDDIFSVSAVPNKAFYVTQLNQTYAGELYAGANSFYEIGGASGFTHSQINLLGTTFF